MESPLGEIITFYSYKGGAGRSMALANIAYLLAKRQKSNEKVLMIDWDLEAPGLHQFFHGRFHNVQNERDDLPPEQLGLIDLFYEIKTQLEKKKLQNNIPDDIFSEIDIQKYIIKINLPSLFLMPAGKFDGGMYSTRVNEFDWEDFFNKFPSVITQLAQYLRKKFKYVLIDSRTGYTDISGICTSIMPEKLVTVFTPNRQSLSGVVEMIRRAINYRKQSDDLRPLMIFPLPSRIENAESKLQKDWRFGNSSLGVEGYQKQIESVLKEVYSLQECGLTTYFDEYQIQYVPRYSYGEEISVLSERSEDRLSLARSFENFTERIIGSENPWEGAKDSIYHSKLEREKREAEAYEIYRKRTSRRKFILQSIVAIFVVAVIVLVFFVASNLVIPPTAPPQSVLQFLYDLINWQYFGILVIIWLLVDLTWVGRWKALLGRIGKLIAKPWIFEKDKEPLDTPLYPREFLEQLALSTRREDTRTDRTLANWIDAQRSHVFDAKNPIRSLGYVVSLLFFIFFVVGDAIIVANTLVLMGTIPNNLPPILQRMDLATLGGALLSAIIGVWMLVEMSGDGQLINTDQLADSQKSLFRIFSLVITFFSVAVMVALAVQRFIVLGYLQSSATTDLILSFILYGVLAINTSLSAALTFPSAASGLIVLIYLLGILIIGFLPVFIFFIDVLWRAQYIILDILIWAVFTPVIAIPYGISRIFSLVDYRA